VSLSHFEILSEILVSAPPVGPYHVQSLVSSGLMEVRVSHIILLSVDWESSISVTSSVLLICLSESVSPVLNHLFLLYNDHNLIFAIHFDCNLLFLMVAQSKKDEYKWKMRRT
jgi:hypothetical protein